MQPTFPKLLGALLVALLCSGVALAQSQDSSGGQGQPAQQSPAERLARVMAAVDGRAWQTMLPQARAALREVWRMMDGAPPSA